MSNQIPIKGSEVTLTAIGTVVSATVVIPCISEDYPIPWGALTTKKKKCHKEGVKITRGSIFDWDTITFNLDSLPFDKADDTIQFLMDSLYENAGTDFDLTNALGDVEFEIKIEFTDQALNIITLRGFTTRIDSMAVLDDEVTISFVFQPTTAPVRT